MEPDNRLQRNWKRPFFTIWSGQAFSLFGSSLAGFALVWWLTSTTGSAKVLAGSTLMMILPQIFLGPVAGALVDRWNRRLIMIVADCAIALFSLGLACLFIWGQVHFWHIYVILFVRALGGAFHLPAMQAATPLMVPEKQLSRVAGMNQTLSGVMSIIAPPMGAMFLSILPIQGILMLDVGTAVLAVVPLLFISIPSPVRSLPEGAAEPASGPEEKRSVWQDMGEGLRFVWGWTGLAIFLLMVTLVNFTGVPAMSLMPLVITQHFGLGALELGWMQTASGIGLVTGGLVLSAWGGFRSRMVTVLAAALGQGIGFILIGAAPVNGFVLAVIGSFVFGLMSPIINGSVFAMIQAIVPPEKQGRVLSLMLSAAAAMAPLGLAVAGPIVDVTGVQFWILLAGILTIVAGGVGFLVPAVLRIEAQQGGSLALEKGL
jgi:DHA3 family macrolide efflux protein-like MFS transporter